MNPYFYSLEFNLGGKYALDLVLGLPHELSVVFLADLANEENQ